MPGAFGEQGDSVGERLCNGSEALDGALQAPGQIDYDGATADAADGAREVRERRGFEAPEAHQFGEPRRVALDDVARGFGRHIPRREARAACRHDELDVPTVGVVAKALGDRP